MTTLNSGQLRTRIEFERRTTAQGSRGQSTNSWELLGIRDCQYQYLSGRKLELARQLFARATIEVRLRRPFDFELKPQDRGKIGSLVLTIGSALPSDEKFDDLVLLCEVEQ
jgi:head-tail adaptor